MNTEREADFRLPSLMRQNSPAATKRTGRRTPPPGYGRQNSPSVLRQNGPSVTILLQTINSFFFCMSVCMISFIQVGSIKFLPRTCQSLRPIYRCDKMSTNRSLQDGETYGRIDTISIRSLSVKCGLAITSLTTMLERMEHQGLISRVQSETDKRKTLLFLTEKAHALKGEYDSVSDEMGSIYYKGFSEEEITRFEECLDRIRKNLEEWQKS